MTDVSYFWIAFGCYLAAMFVLGAAAIRRGGEAGVRLGRGLVWLGLLAHSVSIVARSLRLGTEPLNQFVPRLRLAFSRGPAWHAWVYVLLVAVPVAAAVLGVVCRKRRPVWLIGAGVALMLELILLDFLDFARLPIERVYEYLSIAAWACALALVAFGPVLRLAAADAAMAVATVLVAVFAAIHPHDIKLHLVPALQSYWLFIHVSLAAIAFAVFGVGFIVAAMLLVKAHDPSAVTPAEKRRGWLALAVSVVLAVATVWMLVRGGVVLRFREVTYTREQIKEARQQLASQEAARSSDEANGKQAEAALDKYLPSVTTAQRVRYAAALLGAGCAAAFIWYWLVRFALGLAAPTGDTSGRAACRFAVNCLAMFAACLLLAGALRRQEAPIARALEQRNELIELHNKLIDEPGGLSAESLGQEVKRMAGFSEQARAVLAKARWLPVTFEDQATLKDDPLYQSLVALFRDTGERWRPPVRYKDIKDVGRKYRTRADVAAAVVASLGQEPARADVREAVEALARKRGDDDARQIFLATSQTIRKLAMTRGATGTATMLPELWRRAKELSDEHYAKIAAAADAALAPVLDDLAKRHKGEKPQAILKRVREAMPDPHGLDPTLDALAREHRDADSQQLVAALRGHVGKLAEGGPYGLEPKAVLTGLRAHLDALAREHQGRDARAALAEVRRTLDAQATLASVVRKDDELRELYKRLEAEAILPRGAVGQVATFVGIAALVALVLSLAMHPLAHRLRDRLPDASRLDRISYGAVVAAYPIFTFGALFAGCIWAHFAWGSWWGWDPKESGSLVAWVLYTIYLHQRYREGLKPRAAAVFAMLGFLAAALSLAGNSFMGGLHAYS